MATSVMTPGGVNINDLTSGERILLGLLGIQFHAIPISGQSDYLGSVNGAAIYDFSNITQINVTRSGATDPEDERLCMCCGKSIKYGTHDIVPYASVSRIISVSPLSNAPSYNNNTEIVINSFTTTDGKVHTASNLNY